MNGCSFSAVSVQFHSCITDINSIQYEIRVNRIKINLKKKTNKKQNQKNAGVMDDEVAANQMDPPCTTLSVVATSVVCK